MKYLFLSIIILCGFYYAEALSQNTKISKKGNTLQDLPYNPCNRCSSPWTTVSHDFEVPMRNDPMNVCTLTVCYSYRFCTVNVMDFRINCIKTTNSYCLQSFDGQFDFDNILSSVFASNSIVMTTALANSNNGTTSIRFYKYGCWRLYGLNPTSTKKKGGGNLQNVSSYHDMYFLSPCTLDPCCIVTFDIKSGAEGCESIAYNYNEVDFSRNTCIDQNVVPKSSETCYCPSTDPMYAEQLGTCKLVCNPYRGKVIIKNGRIEEIK